MLISFRRIAISSISCSRFPPNRPPSRRVLPLLPHSPLTTGRNRKPVPEILKDYGFTDAQIDTLARKYPWILSSRSGDLVGARVSYLCQELGLDRSDLIKMVTSDPFILRCSLENTIIPSLNYLKSLLGTQHIVRHAIDCIPGLLRRTRSRVEANVAMLKDSGVPDTSIRKLLLTQRWTLVYHKPERFRSLLASVISMGFDPSKMTFLNAIDLKSMNSLMWEKKVKAYMSFGWSHDEAELAFRRWPNLYGYSEERLRRHLDFAMNVLGMRPTDVLVYKQVLMSNLERTLIPRCCVLNLLMRKGLVNMDMNVPSALVLGTRTFVKRFVEKYQDHAPEVLEAYQGKMQFLGFDHK